MNKEKVIRNVGYVYLPALTAIYLMVMYVSSVLDLSFCKNEGCELSGEILILQKEYLYLLGAAACTTLALIGYNAANYLKKYEIYFMFILGLMVCAETILLSFLYISMDAICLICTIFYLLLVVNFLVIYSLNKRILKNSSSSILLAIFTVVFFLMIDFRVLGNSDSVNISNGYTLITKQGCKYCQKTKETLKEKGIAYTETSYKEMSGLMSSLNLNTVPVLLSSQDDNITIYKNFNAISSYLQGVGTVGKLTFSDFENSLFNGSEKVKLFDKEQEPAGCSVDIVKEEDCD